MIRFSATLKKFDQKGEKTGWTFIEVSAEQAQELKPGNRKEFKVKGKMDSLVINRVSLLPVGGGSFIMPVNAAMRKATGKRHGAMVKIQLAADNSEFVFNKDFMDCLEDEPGAFKFFNALPGSHQRYISKWIDAAKTEPTRAKRIAQAVNGLAKKWGFPEILRALREQRKEWGL